MRDLLFPSSPVLTGGLRAAAQTQAVAFVAEARAIVGMYETAESEHREFVHGEVACVLHVSPVTAQKRAGTALALMAQPRLVAALDDGQVGVGHAMALLEEVSHLEAPHAAAVLDAVLDGDEAPEATPGELRAAAKRAAIRIDPEVARRRHEAAKKAAGVRGRPLPDGMAQVIVDGTAVQMATALGAVKGRAAAMTFDAPDLTQGRREVAALLHALGCDRTHVQAVLECPVEQAVDLHALAGSGVWSVDVRIPLAVALGLSDHPALLSGYGPIGADQARALLPSAELVQACVDARTGEVLTVSQPLRARTWAAADSDRVRALRTALLAMAGGVVTVPDLTCDGYVPSTALGRLVDLRDVTSTFPGDATSARLTDRDHRLPHPLGPTSADNLQNITRRWHRAKHTGWSCRLLPDGSTRWTSPGGGRYTRHPKRTRPPDIPPGTTLPPLDG